MGKTCVFSDHTDPSHNLTSTLQRKYIFMNLTNLIQHLLISVFLITCLPTYAIGLKIVKEYPQTLLATSKTWGIDIYDDDWAFFATKDGLVQYDGAVARMFQVNNRYALRSVKVDREHGRVYVGGINEFGYFVPSPVSSLEYVCLSDSLGQDRHIGNIWGVYPWQGRVIAQGDARIAVYHEDTRKHEIINTQCKLDCSNFIDGVLWLGTDRGLRLLMGSNVIDAPGAEALRDKRIRAILPFNKALLIVTATDGIYMYDRSNLTRLDAASKAACAIGDIFSADLHDSILVLGGVDNGVGVINLNSGSTILYNECNGLANNTALSVKFDIRGDIWAGLDPGVSKIKMTTPIETFNNKALQIGSGYVVQTVGDKLYLGTNRGLFHVDYLPGADLSQAVFRRVEGLTGQVWGLSKIGDDLFCCHDRGLYLVAGSNASKIGNLTGVWEVQPYLHDKSKILAGTYTGFYILSRKGGRWVEERQITGYSDSSYNFEQESRQVIWTRSGEQGIYRIHIDPAGTKVEKIENFLTTADGVSLRSDVYVSRVDNDIYLSTLAGIYRFDSRRNEIVRDESVSLLLGSPRSVRRFKKQGGWLYALTDKEILQGDPAGIQGLRRIPVMIGDGRPMHDGNLLFDVAPGYVAYPTCLGFAFFDFKDPSLKPAGADTVPGVMARINRFAVTTPKDSTIYTGNFIGKKGDITLDFGCNSVKIEFGGNVHDEVGTLYSCRLNNGKWTHPTLSGVKEYTDLKEGDYLFQVKAIGADGREAMDEIRFVVLPPWWRSGWAMAAYVVLVAMAVWGLVLMERRRVRLQQQELIRENNDEIARQQAVFEWESKMKDHKIVELEKEQLDKELRHKAQEMANVMMSLAHKNETLQTVKKDLQDIQQLLPKTSSDARRAIVELQGKISVDLKSDEVFDRVVEEFDLVHNDFIKRLKDRYPELTNNEILMCAYIKMNLSTKEIAPLLNISVRGVETMRYRIRKKFQLERDESLTDFLQKGELT